MTVPQLDGNTFCVMQEGRLCSHVLLAEHPRGREEHKEVLSASKSYCDGGSQGSLAGYLLRTGTVPPRVMLGLCPRSPERGTESLGLFEDLQAPAGRTRVEILAHVSPFQEPCDRDFLSCGFNSRKSRGQGVGSPPEPQGGP